MTGGKGTMMLKLPKHQLARKRRDALTNGKTRLDLGLPLRPARRPVGEVPFPANPGEFVWFALRTLPQGEEQAARALHRAGFVAFNPAEDVLVRRNRKARYSRQRRRRAILTSIVLVGFRGVWRQRRREWRRPDGVPAWEMIDELVANPPWRDVLDLPEVVGVIGMDGAPVPLRLADVLLLRAMGGRPAPTRKWSASIGAAAAIVCGPFSGHAGQVVGLRDGEALLRLDLGGVLAFLAEPVRLPEDWLDAPALCTEEA